MPRWIAITVLGGILALSPAHALGASEIGRGALHGSVGRDQPASDEDAHWWDGFGTQDQSGLSYFVYAMTEYQGKLAVGGYPTFAGGLRVGRVALWDGKSWSALRGGVDDFDCPEIECRAVVFALAVYDSSLIVAGSFPSVDNGLPANYIARWDGVRWHSMGSGMNDRVVALAVYGGELIAAGFFTVAGGRAANHIARWDGSQWQSLGPGLNGWVSDLTVYESELIAAGPFAWAGQVHVNRIARWDGSQWYPLAGGVDDAPFALCTFKGNLVAGNVYSVEGMETYGMAQWNGDSWSPLISSPIYAGCTSCVVYNGNLLLTGNFTRPFGTMISRWTGTTLEPLGSGLDDVGEVLAVHDGSLYVGGMFQSAGGKPSSYIARWDDVITPVLVQDLRVQRYTAGVRLDWRLANDASGALTGVHVQRSEDDKGPYVNRTAVPLGPWMSMSFEDGEIAADVTYWYRLLLIYPEGSQSFVGPVESAPLASSRPQRLALDVTSTGRRTDPIRIRYDILDPATPVQLGIYDVSGRRLISIDRGIQGAGSYLVNWDAHAGSGASVSNGVYVVRVRAGQASVARKFVLLR